MPGSEGESVDQCIALTSKGTRCTRDATDGKFCYQHDASNETIDFEDAETASPAEESAAKDEPAVEVEPQDEDDRDSEVEATAEGTDVADELRTKATDVTEDVRETIAEYGSNGDRDLMAELRRRGETAKEVGTERAKTAVSVASSKAAPVIESVREELGRLRSRISNSRRQTERESARK